MDTERSRASVVVAGGGLAGARTCQELRKNGFVGTITLLGDESVLPYDRPPLSKAVLRGKREAVPLKIDYSGLEIDVQLDSPALGLDLDSREVDLGNRRVGFDRLVIATGARPITLPGAGEQLTLRTAADASALRARMEPGAHIVIVGASWIGAEVATVALERDCRVTCIEAGPVPLGQALSAELARRLLPWWDGIDLVLGRTVREVVGGGVVLDDGCLIDGDAVLVGVGVRPNTAWLGSTPIQLRPAVVVDTHFRTSVPDVYAIGDVAAWWSGRFGVSLDVQHWDDAYSAPSTLAKVICDGASSTDGHDAVPYFWSDQFGHRVEFTGHAGGEPPSAVREGADQAWSAAWAAEDGSLRAVLTVDQPKELAAARKLIAAGGRVTAEDLASHTFAELLARAQADSVSQLQR